MAKMQDRRSELYFLFEWLRDLGTLTFLISERPLDLGTGGSSPEEAYLADGILALEMHSTSDLFVQRRLRVVKMRGTKHDTGVLRVLLRRWVVRGDAGRQRDRIGVIRHLFGMGPPNAYELSDEIANLLASPLYPPGNWCDVLREGILASVQAPTDPPWPRRLPLRSRGRTAQPPLPSSWLTATKTTRF